MSTIEIINKIMDYLFSENEEGTMMIVFWLLAYGIMTLVLWLYYIG